MRLGNNIDQLNRELGLKDLRIEELNGKVSRFETELDRFRNSNRDLESA